MAPKKVSDINSKAKRKIVRIIVGLMEDIISKFVRVLEK